MHALPVMGLCLIGTLASVAPVMAGETPAGPVSAAVMAVTPITVAALPTPAQSTASQSTPQQIIAAQTAETLGLVEAMRIRLTQIVPTQTPNDAVSMAAANFANRWDSIITGYAATQMQMIDTMIIGLNTQTQAQITAFQSAERMTQQESLFSDPTFAISSDMPINFTNPPLFDAGFFGS